jgi:hypothetical protein
MLPEHSHQMNVPAIQLNPDNNPNNVSAIDIETAAEVAAFAGENKDFYFSCRSDYFWRKLHTCDDENIINALATTHLALAFPNTDLGMRTCKKLDTRLDQIKKLEVDSCFAILPKTEQNEIVTATRVAGKNNEKFVANDINERGAVCFAEVQQQKQTAELPDRGRGKVTVDILPSRLATYANFAATRDHGNPSTAEDARNDKRPEDGIFSRSIVGVAYYCYENIGTFKHNVSNCVANLSENVSQVCGRALTMVSLGRQINKKTLLGKAKKVAVNVDEHKKYDEIVLGKVKALQKSVCDHLVGADNEVKKLASEVIAVFSMSHILTPGIVESFSKVVQDMCKILEVNMENIQKAKLSDEQVKELFGAFRTVDQEKARTKDLEARANRLERELKQARTEIAELRKGKSNSVASSRQLAGRNVRQVHAGAQVRGKKHA